MCIRDSGLTIATVMAGIILVIFGLLKFGSVIKFIPFPIVTGFTSGIAVVLCSTQVKDLLALKIDVVPADFIEKWGSFFAYIGTANLVTIAVGVAATLIIVLWPKINKLIPGSLVAIVVVTAVVTIFKLPVETIGSRFGELSAAFPAPRLPNINFQTIQALIMPAITIAILAGIESLLSAVVADGMISKKHRSNTELFAQGIANIASGLFGGIPATGAIARTAANVKNGGRTPIAGIVHAISLLVMMLAFMSLAKLIPMAALGAILVVVAYNMSEWRAFKSMFRSTKSDTAVMLITFIFTVFFDLVLAIEVGMVLAMFLFIKKMSESTQASNITPYLWDETNDEKDDAEGAQKVYNDFHEKLMVYEINGPLFFGAANTFLDLQNEMNIHADILILRMKNVPIMDVTAFNVLTRIDKHCRKHHIMLLFTELQEDPKKLLTKMGYIEMVGPDRFVETFEEALKIAEEVFLLKQQLAGK